IFGLADVPVETAARRRMQMAADNDELQQRLDELDNAFWRDADNLATRIENFAITHGLVRVE
ncbi:hypothetical protein, partial [Escherichia coli]